MNTKSVMFRELMSVQEYGHAITQFTNYERVRLTRAAMLNEPVDASMYPKAADQDIIYRSTGRLRPMAAKILLGVI